jgi:hypothetical protein
METSGPSIVVENGSKHKTIGVKNVKPLKNVEVIRDDDDDSSISSLSSLASSKPSKKKQPKKQNRQEQNFDYSSFSNPTKVKHQEPDESDSEYSDMTESDESDYSESSASSEGMSFKEQQKLKQDLLIKIQALEKKGFEFSKKFTMSSDYTEMQFEFEKVKKFIESQAAIRFSRRCLMACVTGLEFLNKKFDPFSVQLEGWSENVMENIDDYDNIFERLHEKYSGKAEIAPEIELLLTLGGSAFMFHLTNSLLRPPQFQMNNQQQSGGFNISNMLNTMARNSSQTMPQQQPMGFSSRPAPQTRPGPPPPQETRNGRQEMKGPSIDPRLFSGTTLNNYPMPPAPIDSYETAMDRRYNDQQFNDEDRFSVASTDSSLSSLSDKPTRTVKVKAVKNAKSKGGGIELNIN